MGRFSVTFPMIQGTGPNPHTTTSRPPSPAVPPWGCLRFWSQTDDFLRRQPFLVNMPALLTSHDSGPLWAVNADSRLLRFVYCYDLQTGDDL